MVSFAQASGWSACTLGRIGIAVAALWAGLPGKHVAKELVYCAWCRERAFSWHAVEALIVRAPPVDVHMKRQGIERYQGKQDACVLLAFQLQLADFTGKHLIVTKTKTAEDEIISCSSQFLMTR